MQDAWEHVCYKKSVEIKLLMQKQTESMSGMN